MKVDIDAIAAVYAAASSDKMQKTLRKHLPAQLQTGLAPASVACLLIGHADPYAQHARFVALVALRRHGLSDARALRAADNWTLEQLHASLRYLQRLHGLGVDPFLRAALLMYLPDIAALGRFAGGQLPSFVAMGFAPHAVCATIVGHSNLSVADDHYAYAPALLLDFSHEQILHAGKVCASRVELRSFADHGGKLFRLGFTLASIIRLCKLDPIREAPASVCLNANKLLAAGTDHAAIVEHACRLRSKRGFAQWAERRATRAA